jgi:hypothetical protein
MRLIQNLMGFVILTMTVLRFYGLSWSPPEFFVDEAAGASHAICVQQTGSDFTGRFLPLYSEGPGPGSGKYSAPFVFGEALWTAVFGTTTSGFRSFAGSVTTLTIFFVYLWLRRRTNRETALTAAFLGVISPWAFQFSRIAWDPPLAPFFILLGMLLMESEKKVFGLFGSFAMALGSYAYPPARIHSIIVFLFFGGRNLREKSIRFAWYLFFLIPMFFAMWTDPGFTDRGKALAIWTYHTGPLDLFIVFCRNLLLHLSPDFLLIKGDQNLRHSIQSSGMMSIPEWFILHAGFFVVVALWIHEKFRGQKKTGVFSTVGLMMCGIFGFFPAAATVESLPQIPKAFLTRALAMLLFVSILSTTRYLYHYFLDYPVIAANAFGAGSGRIDSAFPELGSGKKLCVDFQTEAQKLHP